MVKRVTTLAQPAVPLLVTTDRRRLAHTDTYTRVYSRRDE